MSLALLAYLLPTTDLAALLRPRPRTATPCLFALAVVLYAAMLALSTWRWRLLLQAQGHPGPLRRLSASYLVATFFNNFLPSNIGGDVIRVRDSSRLTGSTTTTSLAVVAIDRILGFGALYVLARGGLPPGRSERAPPRGARGRAPGPVRRLRLPGLDLLPAGDAPAASWPSRASADCPGPASSSRPCRPPCTSTASGSSRSARRSWRSLALQTLSVLYYFAIAQALRIALPALGLLPDGPALHADADRPDLLQRLGHPRERVHPSTSRQIGLPRESALAFSLVGAGLIVLLSLSGAVVWTLAGRAPSPRPPPPDGRSASSTSATSSAWRGPASTACRASSPGGSRATTARASR